MHVEIYLFLFVHGNNEWVSLAECVAIVTSRWIKLQVRTDSEQVLQQLNVFMVGLRLILVIIIYLCKLEAQRPC